MEAGLSARDDRGSSFHRCAVRVSLVQACLCARKTRYRCFNLQGGTVKHVQACSGTREVHESSFHRCGGPVRLVQASLYAGKT